MSCSTAPTMSPVLMEEHVADAIEDLWMSAENVCSRE
jgi:hypothetical protein